MPKFLHQGSPQQLQWQRWQINNEEIPILVKKNIDNLAKYKKEIRYYQRNNKQTKNGKYPSYLIAYPIPLYSFKYHQHSPTLRNWW